MAKRKPAAVEDESPAPVFKKSPHLVDASVFKAMVAEDARIYPTLSVGASDGVVDVIDENTNPVALTPDQGEIRTGAEFEAAGDWTRFRTGAEFAAEIAHRYGRIKDEFLAIGRMLNHAKATLPHGEFIPMLRVSLPFAEDTAEKLMVVAENVDARRIDPQALPPAYSIAYQIASLKDHELAQAVAEGLVRPDVQRKEIEAFKRRVRRPYSAVVSNRRIEIEVQIGRLQAQIMALRDELLRLPDGE